MVLLVFGATGLLGQAIRAEAVRRRIRAFGVARANADHVIDLSRIDSLAPLFGQLRPQIVINAAAQTSLDACESDPGESYRINARAVALIADQCRAVDTPFVQISTDHFFSGGGDRRHGEMDPVVLVNEYARSKYAGEAFALAYPRSLVLRTNIAGFRGWTARPTFAEWLLDSLAKRKPLRLFDDFHTSTIDVPAFSRALFDLLEKGATGLVNLASRSVSSKRQFAHALARSIGVDLDWDEPASLRELKTPRAESLGLDVTIAERLLGYRLPTLEEVCRSLALQWTKQPCATTPS